VQLHAVVRRFFLLKRRIDRSGPVNRQEFERYIASSSAPNRAIPIR
jgi:hypothetical protein